jgi:GNAT superfamily N-acetyltransferase
MRANEFINEISDQRLQDYLSRAGRQVDARQERIARVRDRLNKGYEIYHADAPSKIVDRFEARTPQEAKRYYDDFITKYESDVDYDLRLRRATGLSEGYKRKLNFDEIYGKYLKVTDNSGDPRKPGFSLVTPLNGDSWNWRERPEFIPLVKKKLNQPGFLGDHKYQQIIDSMAGNKFDPAKHIATEDTEDYAGMQIRLSKDSDGVAVRALAGGRELGMAEFFFDEEGRLDPQTVWVDERYHGQGIAAAMYDYLKDKGYTIVRSWDQTDAGRGFWDKHRGAESTVWENFADGKIKGKSRPGRVKRAGASCNGSVTDLRRKAKNSSGEKAKMYHWCANMKSGKKKNK